MFAIITTLSDSFVSRVVGCAISCDLWFLLEKMFASQFLDHIMQIHYQLATWKKGNSKITDYFQKIKTLSDTLAAIG